MAATNSGTLVNSPRDAGGADAQLGGHRARAPVPGRLGLALGGQLHQTRHIDRAWRRATRLVALDARRSQPAIALAPARDLHSAYAQLVGVGKFLPESVERTDDCAQAPMHDQAG